MKRNIACLISLLFVLATQGTHAQGSYFKKPDSAYRYVQPSASLQFWGLYSMGEKAQLEENGALESVDDRLTFMARRARIGFKGMPYKKLYYNLTVQYDNLGKDKINAARGGTNTGQLGILDAYVSYQVTNNDWLWVTAGYMQPQTSREAITGDLLVNSFDKSISQGYIRQHINGKSYGRATGLNIGGLKRAGIMQWHYNVGLFSNNSSAADTKRFPESTGVQWSPHVIERLTWSIGDPDRKGYSLNYDVNNYFNKRKGVTVGAYHSHQGKTDVFDQNVAKGVDVLFNYSHINIDAEWNWLEREVASEQYVAQTGHVRLGYNIIIAKRYFIEPTISWATYYGNNGGQFEGSDTLWDMGINWYINNKNCKVALHYLIQEGKGNNSYTDGVTFQKGNYVGLAFVLMI